MSDAYERVKAGKLTLKGVTSGSKSIQKKKKKKKAPAATDEEGEAPPSTEAGEVYTIDAAKKMKYEELFPVETKKFGYDPELKKKSVEEALDDRVKKKADRYCK